MVKRFLTWFTVLSGLMISLTGLGQDNGGSLKRYSLDARVTVEEVAGENTCIPLSICSGQRHHTYNQASEITGFEPFSYRTRVQAAGEGTDFVPLSLDWNIKDGFYNGARARVYQLINGKMVLIRSAEILEHHNRGWLRFGGGNYHADPEMRNITFSIGNNWKTGVPIYFTIRAIAIDGTESNVDSHVEVMLKQSGSSGLKISKKNFRARRRNPDTVNKLPAVKNVRLVKQDGDKVELSWEAEQSRLVKGYAVYYSQYDPASHQQPGLKLANMEPESQKIIRKGDLVFIDHEITSLSRNLIPDSVYNNGGIFNPPKFFEIEKRKYWWSDSDQTASWRFVRHPGELPEELQYDGGKTCMEITLKEQAAKSLSLLLCSHAKQDWYYTFMPGDYVFEYWARAEGDFSANLTFQKPIPGVNEWKNSLQDGEWKKYSRVITFPAGSQDKTASVKLEISGKGKIWIDNLRVYRHGVVPGEPTPIQIRYLKESGMRYWRTHEPIKTKGGYTMAGFTNRCLGSEQDRTRGARPTLPSLLAGMKGAKINPWLQIEMCMDKDEWLGFMEYMAAPYDPAEDSPKTKPWAWKRWMQGQKQPWIDEFDKIGFEISNEVWNGSFRPWAFMWETMTDCGTGQVVNYGGMYGSMFQLVIDSLRQSPYWTPECEKKFHFFLGGWGLTTFGYANSFGRDAAVYCPDADELSFATYNSPNFGDYTKTPKKAFYMLQWAENAVQPSLKGHLGDGVYIEEKREAPIHIGLYEYGPSFPHKASTNAEGREMTAYLCRGQVAAAFTLDASLKRAQAGFHNQTYFTWGNRINKWGTHSVEALGGHPYPLWNALVLMNRYASGGRFLKQNVISMPVYDIPSYKTEENMHSKVVRKATPDSPLVGIYCLAKEDDVIVFVISRKVKGYPFEDDEGMSQVSLKLPFTRAGKITLHKIAGDLDVDNRYEEKIKLETREIPVTSFSPDFTLDNIRGATADGIEPASIYCYVFEETDFSCRREGEY